MLRAYTPILAEWTGRLQETRYRGLAVVHTLSLRQAVEWLTEAAAGEATLCIASKSARDAEGLRGVCGETLSPQGVARILGREYDAVLIVEKGLLLPNTVAAAAETVKGGGFLALILPPLEHWNPGGRYTTSTYKSYLVASFTEAPAIFWVDGEKNTVYAARAPAKKEPVEQESPSEKPVNPIPRFIVGRARGDQLRALDRIVGFLRGKGRSIAVIGDRGRGKTGLLALLAAYLVATKRIGFMPITAPTPYNVQPFFKVLSETLAAGGVKHWTIERHGLTIGVAGPWFHIRYHTPEAVHPGPYTLVDEAAALGPARLRKIARRAPRVIIATTIHGYEGSGRTLAKTIEELLPEPRLRVELSTPIRYPQGDPLEQWLYNTFLLDAEPPPPPTGRLDPVYHEPDRRMLAENRRRLRAVYGIIVQAHYRNEPNDLVMMIDAPHHSLHALYADETPVAVAETAAETCQQGYEARMLVDLLAQHTGYEEVCTTRGVRVVRIAVHPALQRRRLGTRLLRELEARARKAGADWIGAVFGRQEVVGFWLQNGYSVVHVSPLPNRMTGEKNIAVAKPLTARAEKPLAQAAQAVRLRLLLTAATTYRDLPAEQLAEILSKPRLPPMEPPLRLTAEQRRRLAMLAKGMIDYESATDALIAALIAETMRRGGLPEYLTQREAVAIVARVLQGKTVEDIAAMIGATPEETRSLIRSTTQEIAAKVLD